MCHRIEEELSDERISKYASTVNKKYQSALVSKCMDFSAIRSRLVTSDDITDFYQSFKETFPVCHMVFAMASSTSYSPVEHGWSCVKQTVGDDLCGKPDDRDGKQRQMLKLFCDIIWLGITLLEK